MKKVRVMMVFMGVLIFGMVGVSRAATVEFNFNSLTSGTGINLDFAPISTYMSGIYGSPVAVTGAYVGNNSDTGFVYGANWDGNSTNFLSTQIGALGGFEIRFLTVPITELYGSTDGYVFRATLGADFTLTAYEGLTILSNQVYTNSWNSGTGLVNIPDIIFSSPVSLLVFSNTTTHDVGIDNLRVESAAAVPEPSTLILLGSALVGLVFFRRMFRKN